MSDLIDREHVIDFLKFTRDSEYEKSMSAEVKHKSVIRSKHDAHVAFCDYLIEYVNQVPTHPTPSNTLGALDCVSRQAAIDTLDGQIEQCDKALGSFDISMKDEYAVKVERASLTAYKEQLEYLPSVQPERTCVNCGRTVNNGGWYADGGTRCPIEEHYALPKDGYCHLWEKRNVTDDDYPERREE